MKKFVIAAIVIILIVALGTVGALASGPAGSGWGYVDADGDGVCDNFGVCGKGARCANADGICSGGYFGSSYVSTDNAAYDDYSACDNYGYCGNGYVDADGDGVCDNYGTGGSCGHCGGNGGGHCRGQGHRNNW